MQRAEQLPRSCQEDHSRFFQGIQRTLHAEIIRKLRLATELEQKDDREIVCAEVFADITGELDKRAQGYLKTASEMYFYELLSPFYCANWAAAEALLAWCRSLWGQPYVAPVFALLLHKWLLLNRDAGGTHERVKHVKVLVQGAQHLFWGDVHSGCCHFQPLYQFMLAVVILDPEKDCLAQLPQGGGEPLVSLLASFAPYYTPQQFARELMMLFPASSAAAGELQGRGADNLIRQVLASLQKIASEAALLRYLEALETLQGNSAFYKLDVVTRVKLQAELYALTSPGGPRYPPAAVRRAASRVLNKLFPNGAIMRRFVSLIFRFLHPEDWPFSRRVLAAVSFAASVAMRAQWYIFTLWTSMMALWLATAGWILSRRWHQQ